MADETSTPEGGEALTAEGFAESLLIPAGKPAKEPEAEEAVEAASDEEDEAEAPEEEAEASDADTDADDDSDDEDVAEDDDGPELYTVKVDGEERQVTIDDLRKNYSLESASQKRMREAADLRSTLEAERRQFAAETQQMREAFQARMAELAQPTEQEPDWVALADEDPLGWPKVKAEWDRKQARVHQARQQHQAMQMQEYQQRLEAGRKALFEAIPEWTDAEKYAADTREIGQSAIKAYGFTEQELAGVLDPRMVRVLRDAAQYQKLRAKRPETAKKVAAAPKVVKPGGSKTRADKKAEASRSVAERVRRTGSADAFQEWLLGG